ncbi:exodeoxyribonuclease VII small subunit [Bacillus alveayuensis]|uniref:Exodeoxyribonuclease 7 small subunit n=1 Tax=Aeribacillus alveayuensis TaxID=279215 RepID=A0ABT9VKB0_9BACI|nr:exodeoxyribonuclease VII small subunit [Bacillus alveayuensis]MDQ0161399.1 exodeoxyribonuclease VII small subunit [Bacillus alveayuensis]
MKEEKELTFEQAMEQLEQIVEKLEEGDVPLEKAIQYFQEGMLLSKICHEKLTHAERQMDLILKDNGQLEPFEIQEEE